MAGLRVLLVDDSLIFLEAAANLLAEQEEISIVGKATSGADAIARIGMLKPDLVLMDWEMPGMNGLEAMKIIKRLPDPPRVVLVSLNDFSEYRAAAEIHGADGFWDKKELCRQIPAMLAGAFSSVNANGIATLDGGNGR